MPKENIYEIIGYKWDTISETVSEGMNQIVFMKDKQVVCYVYGYASNNGYGIFIMPSHYENGVATIDYNEDLHLSIEQKEEIVYLQEKE